MTTGTEIAPASRPDALVPWDGLIYDRLPVFLRLRDAEAGGALQAFARVVAEAFWIIGRDIARLERNAFIETCDDWVVPYLAELLGIPAPVFPGQGPSMARALAPRLAVANAIARRRRKGTAGALQGLGRDLLGRPSLAVEFRRTTLVLPSARSPGIVPPRLPGLRDRDKLDRLGGVFDSTARLFDPRPAGPLGTGRGRSNASAGVFVWQAAVDRVDRGQPRPVQAIHPQRERCDDRDEDRSPFLRIATFHPLGIETRLVTRPLPIVDPTGAASELEFPTPIRREALADPTRRPLLYGPGRSLTVWREGPAAPGEEPPIEPVAARDIVVADLKRERPELQPSQVAVDPIHGLLARRVVPGQPAAALRVSFHQARLAALGGGDIDRPARPIPAGAAHVYVRKVDDADPDQEALPPGTTFARSIAQAVAGLLQPGPGGPPPSHAVIEVMDDSTYHERWRFTLPAGMTLELRAGPGRRPTVALRGDRRSRIASSGGATLFIDGLTIARNALRLIGPFARVVLRDSTLVPGRTLRRDGRPAEPGTTSLVLKRFEGMVSVVRSIVGRVLVIGPNRHAEPPLFCLSRSILDAGRGPDACEAISGRSCAAAYLALRADQSTIVGRVEVHQIDQASDCLFDGEVVAARRQIGLMRFCHSTPGATGRFATPRRFQCQPDLALAQGRPAPVPRFAATRFGRPRYLQPAPDSDSALLRGAADGGELGAYHDLYLTAKLENLHRQLDEFTPVGLDLQVVIAD